MTPDELNVNAVTLDAARELVRACPWVNFTSGLRNWREQAHAMAVNTTKNRQFCGQVYKHEPMIQQEIDKHPDIQDVTGLTNLIAQALSDLPLDLQRRFAHPAGRAFDIEVPFPAWQTPTVNAIHRLPRLQIFLEGEAGLPIWHCQFE